MDGSRKKDDKRFPIEITDIINEREGESESERQRFM